MKRIINTETQRETDSTVAGVGIGALSVAVNVLSVTVNDGIGSLEDVNDEEAGSSFSHNGMLVEAVNEVNNTTGRVLADKVAGMTADEKQKMQEKSETCPGGCERRPDGKQHRAERRGPERGQRLAGPFGGQRSRRGVSPE